MKAHAKSYACCYKHCGNHIEVVAECKNAEEGIEMINKRHPDLVFLDIEMPGLTGFEMLRQIGKINFDVIFTTAHDHYAIKAIKFSALDYLLKPIDLEQLKEAIERAIEKRSMKHSSSRYDNFVGNLESKINSLR